MPTASPMSQRRTSSASLAVSARFTISEEIASLSFFTIGANVGSSGSNASTNSTHASRSPLSASASPLK